MSAQRGLDDFFDDADVPDVAPIETTRLSDPSGTVCPACGETSNRLWQDGAVKRCAACKDW